MSYFNKFALTAFILLSASVVSSCTNDAPEKTTVPKKQIKKIAKTVPTPAPKPVKVTMTPEMAGKKVFARCKACHTIKAGGRHLVGPNLHGIIGRKSGAAEGFAYSKAMVASDVVWSEDTIATYMANPKAYIPKNKMAFIGLKKQKDIDNLLAYLKANSAP